MYILYNNCQSVSCLSYLTLNEILTQLMGLKNYSLTKQVREGEREEGGEGRERERERKGRDDGGRGSKTAAINELQTHNSHYQ